MKYDFNREVKLFIIYDILGDTQRTGPLLWKIDRKRLEDIKDHVFDLLLIARILKRHLPSFIDYEKLYDYIICHDLPEAITGDITKFEGVSDSEIKRVTGIAIDYLSERFGNIMDFKTIINGFENKVDIESKIASMIDKVHSATTFIKYQSERNIDMDKSDIIPELRNHPLVVQKINEGKDLADIFYEFHLKVVKITDEECAKYNINRECAEGIVDAIKSFAQEIYNQKLNGTLLSQRNDFPNDAMLHNRNIDNYKNSS